MSKLKRVLPFALLASVVASLVGCGAPGVTGHIPADQEFLPSIKTKSGAEFVLGFSDTRFQKVGNKFKVTKLPRQSLLPVKMDNRSFCSPVANQGKLGSCTAFAMGKGFREFMQRKDGERQVALSPLFLYYESRWDKNRDSGSTNTDNVETMGQTGIAVEESWPYDITKFSFAPPQAAYDSAKEFKYDKFIRISGLEDTKVALSKGYPVLFAYDVMESFRSIGKDGLMPVPKPGEKRLGGHAVLAVGYDNQKQVVTVRNSWGDSWADGGYFYMPYSVYESTARDIWTADYRNEQ